MSYYDEKVARALHDIARELQGIGKTLKSIDRRLAEQNEPEVALKKEGSDAEKPRRGVCGAAELDGTPCVGCRPQPCMYELRGGLENG